MKKKMLYIISIVIIFSSVTGCFNKKEPTSTKKEPDKKIEEQIDNATKEKQEGMIFKDIKIVKQGATSYVRGTVENKSGKTENFKLQLIMSNSDTKRVYGRVETDIADLKDKEKREFEISIVGDYGSVDNFEVKVIK